MVMKYELIVFDMDGTLVEEDSCWRIIHRHFSVQEDSSKNLRAWEDGRIDYREFMKRDIALWKPIPHISQIQEILSHYQLPPKAPEIVDEIRERGYETVILSGGLDVLAEMVARELGIQRILANGLETDDEGYLTGEGIMRVDPQCKDKALKELLREIKIDPIQCACVGDSVYDTELFSMSGMGIAIGDGGPAAGSADVVIQDFKNFDQILNYI